MSNLKKEIFKEAYRKAYNLEKDYVIPIYKDSNNEKLFHVGEPLKKLQVVSTGSKSDIPYWVVATWTINTNNDSLYLCKLNDLVKGIMAYLKLVKKV